MVVTAGTVVVLALGAKGYFGSKPRLLLPAFPLLLPVAAFRRRPGSPAVCRVVCGRTVCGGVHRAAPRSAFPPELSQHGGRLHKEVPRRWAKNPGNAQTWARRGPSVTVLSAPGAGLTRGDLAVSGRDLEELGIRGRAVGETLAALLDRVLEDPAVNTRERLLALARERR